MKLIEGKTYKDTKTKEKVEFRYMGTSGLAIVCEPGDSGGGMQSCWGIAPERLVEENAHVEYDIIRKTMGHCYDGCGWNCCTLWEHSEVGNISKCRMFNCNKYASESLEICNKIYGSTYEGKP